jgi:hypothetical protein
VACQQHDGSQRREARVGPGYECVVHIVKGLRSVPTATVGRDRSRRRRRTQLGWLITRTGRGAGGRRRVGQPASATSAQQRPPRSLARVWPTQRLCLGSCGGEPACDRAPLLRLHAVRCGRTPHRCAPRTAARELRLSAI